MAGIPSTVAAASDSNQIVAASTSGTFAHYRLGNVDFKMGFLLLIGGVVGGTVGVQFIVLQPIIYIRIIADQEGGRNFRPFTPVPDKTAVRTPTQR